MAEIEAVATVNTPWLKFGEQGLVDEDNPLVVAYLANGKLAKPSVRKKAAPAEAAPEAPAT